MCLATLTNAADPVIRHPPIMPRDRFSIRAHRALRVHSEDDRPLGG